jgi:hypothetical protein
MDLFNTLLGGEGEKEEVNFFPTDDIQYELNRSERYKSFLSETLSSYYDIPLQESQNKVENNSEKGMATTKPVSVFDVAYQNNAGPEEVKTLLDRYRENMNLLSTIDNPVVSEDIVKDPVLSTADRYERTIAIIGEAAQKKAPNEGYFGLANSFAGTLIYGMTGGVVENAAGFFDVDAGTWNRTDDGRKKFDAIYQETDDKKAMALAEQYMQEASDLGILGGNTFRYWQQVETIKTGGVNENPGLYLGLDAAGVIPVTRLTRLLPFASDAVSTAAAVKGTGAANKAVTTALNNPNTVSNVAQHTAPAVSRVGNTGLHPSIGPTLQNEVFNDYKATLADLFKEQYITSDQITEVAKGYVDNLSKRIKNHVVDFAVSKVDDFDNREIEVLLGKKDGTKFADQASAVKFRDVVNTKGIGAEVKEVIVNGISDGWVLSYKRNLPMKDFAKPITPADLKSYGLFDPLLSPELTSAQDLLTLRKRGVIKVGSVESKIVDPFFNTLNKVSSPDMSILNTIVQEISLKKVQKDWLNLSDFKDEYLRLAGKDATDEVVEGYKAMYKLSDTFQSIEADKVLKAKYREKTQTYKASFDGTSFFSVKALPKGSITSVMNDPVNPQKFVFDFDSKIMVKAQDFLKGKKTLFKFEDIDDAPIINGKAVTYGTGTVKASRPLTHDDVYRKSAGGYRNSQKIEGFITQRRTVKDISDNTLNKLPRIIAAGYTGKELVKILDDLNSVISIYRTNPLDNVAIEAVLKTKNGFDPTITTADDLREFIRASGLDENSPFEIVNKIDDLPGVGIGNLENYFNGKFKTYDDLYQRGSDNSIIFNYGNVNFNQLDPTRTITRDFAKSINYMAGRSFITNGVEGLIRGGELSGVLENLKSLKGKPLYAQLNEATFKAGATGDLYRGQQRTLLQALNEPSDVSLKWDSTMNNLSNFIFDKTGKDTYNILSKDPVTALRSTAYHMKLGMFNPSQLVLQSFQTMNIIAASPKLGFKAAATYWPMRLAMLSGDDNVLRLAAKRTSGLLGYTEDQFVQLAKYYRDSGLFSISQNIYENRSTMGLTRGFISKIKEGSTFFFREGERISKGMATNVAYLEFLQKPGIKMKGSIIDLDDPETYRAFDSFMNKRADDLTFNMTRASSATWQDGWLGLATQWQSYTAKNIENLAFGRNFTPAERVRMGIAQIGLFGAAGIPLGSYALNALTDSSETDIPKDVYTFLQGGLLDTLMSTVTGEETSMSQRVAVGRALQETISNIYDKKFIEVFGGPSTSIVWNTGDLGVKMLVSRFTGEVDVANYDLTKLLREVSSFNSGVQAYMIWKTGEYINKRGETVATGLNPWQGFWNTLGVQYQQVTLQYDIKDLLKSEKEAVFAVSNRVKELNKIMGDYIDKGDLQSTNKINQDIQLLMSPFSWPERRDILSLSRESLSTTSEKLLREDYRRLGSGAAGQLQKIKKEE